MKWFARENLHEEAIRLLDYADILQAPDLIVPEITNIAWKKCIRGEVTRSQAEAIVTALPHYLSRLWPSRELAGRALAFAFALDHPVYDCLYLACADAAAGILITADQRLCETIGDTDLAPLVRYLGSPDSDADTLLPLQIPLSKVKRLISIAERFEQVERTLGESSPPAQRSLESDQEMAEMFLQSPAVQRLFRYLDELPRNERVDALAIMLLGGGVSDWKQARQTAFEGVDSYESFFMTGPVPVAEDLRRGMAMLREERVPET